MPEPTTVFDSNLCDRIIDILIIIIISQLAPYLYRYWHHAS